MGINLTGVSAQNHAVNIEFILRDVFNCERYGLGGIVNSDFIRKQPFTAIACGLSFLYATAEFESQLEIINFIEEYSFFSEMSIDFILSFDTSSKVVNGINFEIDFKNGEQAVKKIIDDFKKIVK